MYVNIFYTLYYNIIDCLDILFKLLTKIRTIYKVNVNGWKKNLHGPKICLVFFMQIN